MSRLICENLAVRYENKIAVEGVSFELKDGEYLCIAGENGSGKSSLIKAVVGLIRPSAGRILMEGIQKSEIGYLPQQTMFSRDFPATVWETVRSGNLNQKKWGAFYTAADNERTEKNLNRLGISDLKKRSFHDLSGGQKQRVLLARALCATRKLLILDEPVTGLDPVVTEDFYQTVQRINREDGIMILMISHDLTSALRDADKILHLGTKELFFGTPEEYRKSKIGKSFLKEARQDERN